MSDSQYAELIQKAKLAEKLERYEEMADCMKEAIELKGKQDSKLVLLPRKERDMLSVAYKKVVAAKRSSWKAICSIKEKDEEKDERDIRIEEAYKTKIEEELRETCSEVLSLLKDHLLLRSTDHDVPAEDEVLYRKMKGDQYRYLAEVASGNTRASFSEESLLAYKEGYDISQVRLQTTNPVRLGLALNLSVFYYEIRNDPDKACKLAKKAFDDAISELDTLKEETYKDSTLIMQLLRDNLTLWTTPEEDAGNNK